MRRLRTILVLLLSIAPCWPATVAQLAEEISGLQFDPAECYRVRDLRSFKEDLRIYFTEGHLLFARPVAGRTIAALFAANVDGGDAELLTFPPTRGERASMARATGSPGFSEHFHTALLLFTDDTGDILRREIESGTVRKQPQSGILLANQYNDTLRNIAGSFQMRLLENLQNDHPAREGFFYAAVGGNTLGNFDVMFDPTSPEQIILGKVGQRGTRRVFDVWTSFQARSFRTGRRAIPTDPIRIEGFDIQATVNPDLTLEALTTLRITPSQGRHVVLAFEISPAMEISSASIDGVPATVFRRESLRSNLIRGDGNETFLLEPVSPLEPGRQYEIQFQHKGAVISEASRGVYYVGSRGNWYPNRSLQFSQYTYSFRYPEEFDLVTSGIEVEQSRQDGWRTTRRQFPAPMRLLGFNLGKFEGATAKRDGLSVEVWANKALEESLRPRDQMVLLPPPPVPWNRRGGPAQNRIITVAPIPVLSPTRRLDELAAKVADAFQFMAERFGPPPFEHLRVSPIPGGFGQGFPGLVYLSTRSYLDPHDLPASLQTVQQRLFFTDLLPAHETAHQWWGNCVRAATYRDEWIMEALADYSALLFLEKRRGEEDLEKMLDYYRDNLLRKHSQGESIESVGPIVWGTRLRASAVPNAFQVITYQKGAWIIHMLRRILGDRQFFQMLAGLRHKYEYQPLSTEEFQQFAAGFLPTSYPDKKLEILFDHYVRDTGIPRLQLRHKIVGKSPKWRVEGEVLQTEAEESVSVLAPVEIRTAKGAQIHWVRTDAEGTPFEVTLKQRPTAVTLNRSRAVLTRD